ATLPEHRGLVGDVQERLLTQAGVEARGGERQCRGVRARDDHVTIETDQTGEPGRAGGPPGVELDRDDPAAETIREEAGRTAEAGAHVEDAGGAGDAGFASEGLHGGETAVVVLVEVEEVGRAKHGRRGSAPASRGRQHLGLVDGMTIVEVGNAYGNAHDLSEGGALMPPDKL